MKEQYEIETGKQAMVFSPKGMSPSNGYVQWLEEKVEEMMEIMVGEKKGITNEMLKKIANFYGLPVAVDHYDNVLVFREEPELEDFYDGDGSYSLAWIGIRVTVIELIGYEYMDGSWWMSLTLPDVKENKDGKE